MEALAIAPTRGRPRAFCLDTALAAALGVFWAKGYEGASLAELTAAMGITKPSLYAAFGNKEQLFTRALDLYEREKLAYTREALDQPTARAVAEHIMRGAIAAQVDGDGPKGCMGVVVANACGTEAESVRAEVIKRRESSSAALVERFRRAARDGDLPDGVAPEALAQYLLAVLGGMAMQAGAGATRADLEGVLATTLAFWPGR